MQIFAQIPTNDPIFQQKKHYIIKSNPLAMVWGNIPFTSEFRLVQEATVSKKQSSQLWLSGYLKSPIIGIGERIGNKGRGGGFAIRGYRIQLAHKFYMGNYTASPEGFYAGPQISYTSIKFSLKQLLKYDKYIQGNQFNIMCIFGYQAVGEDMAFDIFCGLGYKKNDIFWHYSAKKIVPIPFDDSPELSFILYSPLKITIGMNFGIAFD